MEINKDETAHFIAFTRLIPTSTLQSTNTLSLSVSCAYHFFSLQIQQTEPIIRKTQIPAVVASRCSAHYSKETRS